MHSMSLMSRDPALGCLSRLPADGISAGHAVARSVERRQRRRRQPDSSRRQPDSTPLELVLCLRLHHLGRSSRLVRRPAKTWASSACRGTLICTLALTLRDVVSVSLPPWRCSDIQLREGHVLDRYIHAPYQHLVSGFAARCAWTTAVTRHSRSSAWRSRTTLVRPWLTQRTDSLCSATHGCRGHQAAQRPVSGCSALMPRYAACVLEHCTCVYTR